MGLYASSIDFEFGGNCAGLAFGNIRQCTPEWRVRKVGHLNGMSNSIDE
jgi:hypothetical protein